MPLSLQNLALRSWSLQEWNSRLVAAILRQPTPEGTFDPLTRLTVSRALLARATGLETTPDIAFDAFHRYISEHLKASRHALDTDAEHASRSARWTPSSPLDPPYWEHLVFTCYVANLPGIEAGDYRIRLCELVPGTNRQTLHRLPRLWRKLAEWTAIQSSRHGNCRELVLPE